MIYWNLNNSETHTQQDKCVNEPIGICFYLFIFSRAQVDQIKYEWLGKMHHLYSLEAISIALNQKQIFKRKRNFTVDKKTW